MSIWQRGVVTENPYLRTPFRVAMLPREVTRRPSLVQRIGQARSIATANPNANTIRGRPVSLAEVHEAEDILLHPERRILAELLVHSTETLPLARLRALLRKTAAGLEQTAPDAPSNIAREKLAPLLTDLACRRLDGIAPADPSCGALETSLTPPFGDDQRKDE